MNSPRSLEACRQLGILPDELYFQDFDSFLRMNPEVIGLPKDIQKIRFENIDKYRKESIKMVISQRDIIIKNKKERNENSNVNNNIESSNNMNINENNIIESKQIYNLDDQLNNIITKEKRIQKNQKGDKRMKSKPKSKLK